jgi:hypothetical protein
MTATPSSPSSPRDLSIDSEISGVLQAAHWPANKDDLVDIARETGASNEVVTMFDGLPEQDYANAAAVVPLLAGSFGPGLGI